MKQTYIYLIVLITVLVIDFLWLNVFAKQFYSKELGNLFTTKVNILSALLVYVFLSIGIVFFTLNNNYATSLQAALLIGAFFGFIVYAVYDLTNLAVIKDYSLKLTIVDILWGTFLGAISGTFAKFLSLI